MPSEMQKAKIKESLAVMARAELLRRGKSNEQIDREIEERKTRRTAAPSRSAHSPRGERNA